LPDGFELASVAVRPDRRGEGVGRALVERALTRAEGPVYALCLAPGFFAHLGFDPLDEVPAGLEAKAEGCCRERGFVPMAWRPGS
jgi:N-acetylglutamate synthase-like GNAT family acetyltransferase